MLPSYRAHCAGLSNIQNFHGSSLSLEFWRGGCYPTTHLPSVIQLMIKEDNKGQQSQDTDFVRGSKLSMLTVKVLTSHRNTLGKRGLENVSKSSRSFNWLVAEPGLEPRSFDARLHNHWPLAYSALQSFGEPQVHGDQFFSQETPHYSQPQKFMTPQQGTTCSTLPQMHTSG